MEEQKIEEQKVDLNWLNEEIEETKTQAFDGERKPAFKLEEGKIFEIDIDFSKPFDKWVDPNDNTSIKKILPVKYKGEDKVWWLNVKNPIYQQILLAGKQGQTKFKVTQTGTGKNTKYSLLKE